MIFLKYSECSIKNEVILGSMKQHDRLPLRGSQLPERRYYAPVVVCVLGLSLLQCLDQVGVVLLSIRFGRRRLILQDEVFSLDLFRLYWRRLLLFYWDDLLFILRNLLSVLFGLIGLGWVSVSRLRRNCFHFWFFCRFGRLRFSLWIIL